MTQEEFHETLDRYKAVIPDVYSRVKDQSDTFFIKQALGPNFDTQNVRISEDGPNLKQDPSAQRLPTPPRPARSRSPKYGAGYDL